MSRRTTSFPIPAFQPIDGLAESTQLRGKLTNARNVLLRPLGGFKGIPKYERLWATGSAETMQAFYRRQVFSGYPSGVGVDNAARTANKTCAYLISRQGKAVLVFYDLVNSQCRGAFYLGDDGSYTSGAYDFTAGTPTVTVLAVGLDSTARWYGTRFFKAIYLGNGVDDNVIAQLGRSATPGKWRKAASNVAPSAPVISLVSPAISSTVQAYWTIPASSRAGEASLTFTAKVGLFPGLSGNNKIRVRIANNAAGEALRSELTGNGTLSDPYYYTLVAGSTAANSSNTSVVNFVNADSRVAAILSASTSAADNTADNDSYGPTDLENGSGTGTSTGFSARTVTFYSHYWDPGQENFGYEGVSSAISNEIIIPSSANNDIRVLVPVDSTAEGGRFGYIRLYMQFGEEPDAAWLLINPDDPIPNGGSGTFTRLGASSIVTLTGAIWASNDVVQLTTTGTLPGGLSTGTDYHLIPRFATTRPFLRLSSTDVLSVPGPALADDVLRLTTTGTLPSGLSTGTNYYVKDRSGQTGTFTRYLSTDEITLSGTEWVENDGVQLTTTGTLPGGLSLATNYYLRPGTASGRWKLSLTRNGSAVTLTDAGSGTHTATYQVRAALQETCTFFKQEGWFGFIQVAGTDWAENDIVQLTTSGTLPLARPGGDLPAPQLLTNYYLRPGPTSTSWALSLSYGGAPILGWDTGTGVHTVTLNTRVLLSTSPGGSTVAVTTDGTGIHTSTLSPSSTQFQFSLTPDGPVVALSGDGSGIHTATLTKKAVQVGTQTPFLSAADGGEMFADQNRPLPHTLHAYSNEQVWRAGVTDHPERIYVSKPATPDEVVPEGCNLEDLSFISVLNHSNAGGTNKMTALVASQNRIDCHYATGVTMFDPTDTDQRNFTATTAGAINQTAVAVIEGKGVFILGGDMQLRRQSVEQTGAGFAAAVASSQFEALAAAQYMRSKVDLAELSRKPQRVFVFPNVTDQHLYMSLPALDGTLKMFAYDFLNQGIVGEFDYPKVYAAAAMEPDRPEILFATEDGDLFVWDTANQNDRGDTFGSVSAFTAHSTGVAMPAAYNGWGYVDVGSARYYQAYTSVLETGFLDLAGPDSRKSLIALLFRVVLGSRALVTATVTALDGSSETISLSEAEFYEIVEHRLNVFLGRTTSVKIKFEIVGAEQKAWIIRDLTALFVPQGKV